MAAYLYDQEVAGLDICTDSNARYDNEFGEQGWTSLSPFHMGEFDKGRHYPP